MITPEQIEKAYERMDYRLTNFNIFGIRTVGSQANTFDDVIGVMYGSTMFTFPATTDPGTFWRKNPSNVRGTAILVPGQYKNAYKIGKHSGYTALRQVRKVTVYRDGNRDDALDVDCGEQTGYFGINIHRASRVRRSRTVDKWSAGCQVIADPIHFDFFMSLVARAAERKKSFDYTLLLSKEI